MMLSFLEHCLHAVPKPSGLVTERCNSRGKVVPFPPADMQAVLSKTLIVRFSSVGDIVLSTPLLRLLRRRFPQAQIDYVIRADYADLLRANPYLSNLIEFPAGGTFRDLSRIRAAVRESQYDLILDIHDSLRSRYLTAGAADVERISKRKVPRWILVHWKKDLYARFGGALSITQRYLETVARFGIVDDGAGTEIFVPAASEHRVEDLLATTGLRTGVPWIGICPSARHATKQWPARRFAEAGAALARERGAGILLFGSAAESERCRAIRTEILTSVPQAVIADCSGTLTLLETAAALGRCDAVLTNDSGLMHIAAAQKRKIVAVFGSTTRQLGFFPPPGLSIVIEKTDLDCRPCSHIGRDSCPLGHFRCMEEIPASRVIEALHQQLAR
jgi:lipopolysaccharide heptosyltransferase II